MKPIIAITAGDTNGIGYEVILKALLESHMFEIMRPVIYGNAAVAKKHIQTLDEDHRNITWNPIDSADQAKEGRLNLITCYTDNVPVNLGQPSEDANKAAKASLERACRDLKEGKVQALVTAPLNKEALKGGHTEWLAERFEGEQLMMLCAGNLRVALVCNHVSIAEIPSQITEERIVSKLTLLNQSLKRDFTNQGVDMRSISTDDIERIEIVRGIPSVEYGNLTSGVVIVKTKSGQTPWEAKAQVDPFSKMVFAGKGFTLRDGSAINVSADWAQSWSDTRRHYLGYDRVTASAGYSKQWNRFQLNVKGAFYSNINNRKQDPPKQKYIWIKSYPFPAEAWKMIPMLSNSWKI